MKEQLLDRINKYLTEIYGREETEILMDEFVRDTIEDITNESLIKTFLETDEDQFSYFVNDVLEPVFLESENDDEETKDYGEFVDKVQEEGGFIPFVENEIFIIDNVYEGSEGEYNYFQEAKKG